MPHFKVTNKTHPLAVFGPFTSREQAEKFIAEDVPRYFVPSDGFEIGQHHPRLIPIDQHPDNKDPSSVCISGPVYRGRDIYKHRAGYMATFNGMAIPGLFPTEAAAKAAQATIKAEEPNP